MKAVVVEIKNQYVAVLTDDGTVIKVKNSNYALGQVVQLNNENPLISINKKIATFVASVAAIAVLGTGTWAYASPYSYVNLDINPSIEFTLNRFNRVLKVEASNEDGNYIIEEINITKLKNEKIEDALYTTVDQISKSGYFNDPDEAGLVITASAKNKNTAEKLARDLYEAVDKELKNKGEEVEIQAYSVKITNEKTEEEKSIDKVTKEETKAADKARKEEEKEEKKSLKEDEKRDRKSSKEQEKNDKKSSKEQEKKDRESSKEEEKIDRKSSKEEEKIDRKSSKEEEKIDRKSSKEEEKIDRKPSKEEEKIDRKSSKEEEKIDRKPSKEEEKIDRESSKEEEKNNNKSSENNRKNDVKKNNKSDNNKYNRNNNRTR